MQDTIEQVQLAEQHAAVVRGRVPTEQISDFLAGAFGEVIGALSAQGLAPVGPPFGLYSPPSEEGFEVAAGFPASGPVTTAGRVGDLLMPGGLAVQVMHVGAYADVAAAYQAIEAYLPEHGLVPVGPPWESYLDEPEVAEPRTLVTWPVRPA